MTKNKEQYINKSAVVAELESKIKYAQHLGDNAINGSMQQFYDGMKQGCVDILSSINTIEVKEVNIASMADDYYDALMKEADWMDEGTIGHCRLAYYNGCKDVLNKIQKGE
jgi:hypothetical protein